MLEHYQGKDLFTPIKHMKKANKSNSIVTLEPSQTQEPKKESPGLSCRCVIPSGGIPAGLLLDSNECVQLSFFGSKLNLTAQNTVAFINALLSEYWNAVDLMPDHEDQWCVGDELQRKAKEICQELETRAERLSYSLNILKGGAFECDRENKISFLKKDKDGNSCYENVPLTVLQSHFKGGVK